MRAAKSGQPNVSNPRYAGITKNNTGIIIFEKWSKETPSQAALGLRNRLMSPEKITLIPGSTLFFFTSTLNSQIRMFGCKAGVALGLLGSSASAAAAPQNPITVGQTRFSVLTPHCIRIEQAQDGKFVDAPSLFAISRAARWSGFKLKQDAQSVSIDTGAIQLRFLNDGQPLLGANLWATIRGGATWTPGAKNRGNLGGTLRTLDGASGPVDVGQGILSREGWAVLDNSIDPLLTGDWVQARPQNAGTDWYLFGYGRDYRAALKSLTLVGGPVPLPRKSVLGAWYSRYWPYSTTEFRDIVKQYQQHDFPLDVMVLNLDWHRDGWTGWSWNRELLPDPQGLLADLHREGLQTTLNLHPADGAGPHEDAYAAFMRALCQPADGKTVPFDAANQKQMNALFGEVMAPLKRDGTDFWWLDWQQYSPTRGIPSLTNLWWLNELLMRDTAQGGRRPTSFSRWAGWGDHRHPIHFSGAADAGWKMLAFQVPFTSTAGNVGCFFWSHDIGGHNGGRNEESYARWCQFGAMSAALRSHSSRDASTDRRPRNYPDWAENSMRVSFHLRSEMFPTICSSVAQSARDSVPLTRPLYLDYGGEAAAYRNGQEYLLGDDLLVAPIASPGVGPNRVAHQNVWFPPGTAWFNTFSGEKYAGGTSALCAADINEMPLFARGGVALPMQPYQARMTSAPLETLRVRVFPGESGKTGISSLYQDDGDSDAYKTGASATTSLRYFRRGDAVEICVGAAKGTFKGQLAARALQIELPATKRALGATVNGQNWPVSYDAASATNTVSVLSRPIWSQTIIKISVADANFEALRSAAQARRMKGVTGRDFAPQAPRALLQNALAGELSTPQRNQASAVVGVGMIERNQSPTFAPGDVRDLFFAPPGILDEAARLETVERTQTTLQIGGLAIRLPDPLDDGNIAPQGAVDGLLSGYPNNSRAEWSSGQKVGAMLRLTWKSPQKIHRIALYDRPNPVDNMEWSSLTLSDGTVIELDALADGGQAPYEVRFPAKVVEWVEWKALKMRGENAGLSEIAVHRAP